MDQCHSDRLALTREHRHRKILHCALFLPLQVRTGRYSRWTQTSMCPHWQWGHIDWTIDWNDTKGDLQTGHSPDQEVWTLWLGWTQDKERPPADWVRVTKVGTTTRGPSWRQGSSRSAISAMDCVSKSLGSSVLDLQCSAVLTSLGFCRLRETSARHGENDDLTFCSGLNRPWLDSDFKSTR